MNLLENKTVVITGGCGQVGYATAKRLSAQGARIIVLVRKNLDQAQEMMDDLPNPFLNHQAILASVTDSQSLNLAADQVDQCDVLINAAGVTRSIDASDLESYTDDVIDTILDTNLKGPLLVIREFISKIKKSEEGLIINITSTSMFRGSTSNMVYGASKSGLEVLTKYLAKTLGPKIRVVSVCPGFLEYSTSGATKPPGASEKISKEVPLGRVGTGDDIAAVIESLCTTMKYVNGTSILVDGGRMA
jgi:3-oxoacyl-[acyl-carrier protein] reductase